MSTRQPHFMLCLSISKGMTFSAFLWPGCISVVLVIKLLINDAKTEETHNGDKTEVEIATSHILQYDWLMIIPNCIIFIQYLLI